MESKQQKPKRNNRQTIIINVVIGIVVLWVAGAIATGATNSKNTKYVEQSGPVQEAGHDLSHPLGFITNLENNPIEPDVVVPSTYKESVNQTAQVTLDQLTGKQYSYTDYPPPDTSFTISEALFQAANNGTTVSDSQLSSLLNSAVKSFDESTLTADVSLLFFIKNPGNQKITVDKVANTFGGGNLNGKIGVGEYINWDTLLTVPDKDSELIMPLNAKVYRIAPPKTDNKNYYTDTTLICFTGPDGTNYELTVSEKGVNSVLPALANAPEIGNNGTYIPFSSDAGIEGEILPAGTPIIKTINNNAKISFSLDSDKEILRSDFNFISYSGKLVYIP